ncbi:DoxX family protein [Streptomyces sp. NEAU-W12]|uniref:DoxX family protein n=1 Tax=Streptomyces sp. NEAU-W12 TaxID=2994668 RepID=UPI00224B3CE6|nr:DoxX family protein [Streptomyces sp. NEAU-W12]MCX2928482.1 DoxX family protein [Streptomyces sp. NEAU-W12]
MDVVLWVVAGLLAAVFLFSGATKVLRSREQLIASGLGLYAGWRPVEIKAIGALEVLAAVGLILPAVTGIAPVLVPLAATGLAVTMAGAMVVHARRGEFSWLAPNLALLILAAVVAWGRFGPYAF